MPEREKKAQNARDMVRVCYAVDVEDGDQIIEKLNAEGIKAVRTGGTRDIYKPDSLMGEEILVPAADADRAARILEAGPAPESAGEAPRKNGKLLLQIAAVLGMIAVMVLLAVLVSAIR